MKKLILILCLTWSYVISAQVKKDNLLGKWFVEDVSLITEIPKGEGSNTDFIERMELFRKSLIKCEFNFFDDKLYFKLPPNHPEFMNDFGKMFNDKPWSFNEKQQLITISPDQNIANFIVQMKDGVMYFLMNESPFLLKLQSRK